jgi:hypothetical protein
MLAKLLKNKSIFVFSAPMTEKSDSTVSLPCLNANNTGTPHTCFFALNLV